MYPLNFFNLFPEHPTTNRVFVVTAFDSRFDARFEQVIRPAVSAVRVGGVPLEAFRVNQSRVNDSILLEILQEIRTSRMIFVDVTALDRVGDRPIRNANAMYELGIAHAVRLPEEVLVFRSDIDRIDFDISNLRIRHFSPDTDSASAVATLTEAFEDALRSLDTRRRLTVDRVARALDHRSWNLLATAITQGDYTPPTNYVMAHMAEQSMNFYAVTRLLELGLIRADYRPVGIDQLKATAGHPYVPTPFGRAVMKFTLRNRLTPEAAEELRRHAMPNNANMSEET